MLLDHTPLLHNKGLLHKDPLLHKGPPLHIIRILLLILLHIATQIPILTMAKLALTHNIRAIEVKVEVKVLAVALVGV